MSCQNNLDFIDDFVKGNTETYLITITDDADVPIDITGSIIKITLKKDRTDADPGNMQVEATILDQITNTGEADLTMEYPDTNIDVGSYYYDIEWTNASGDIQTIGYGKVTIFQNITDV